MRVGGLSMGEGSSIFLEFFLLEIYFFVKLGKGTLNPNPKPNILDRKP